jgi:hypothetical protein
MEAVLTGAASGGTLLHELAAHVLELVDGLHDDVIVGVRLGHDDALVIHVNDGDLQQSQRIKFNASSENLSAASQRTLVSSSLLTNLPLRSVQRRVNVLSLTSSGRRCTYLICRKTAS